MHKSNILLIPILVIVVMSPLFSCGKSDISGSHEILNNLLINEDNLLLYFVCTQQTHDFTSLLFSGI